MVSEIWLSTNAKDRQRPMEERPIRELAGSWAANHSQKPFIGLWVQCRLRPIASQHL